MTIDLEMKKTTKKQASGVIFTAYCNALTQTLAVGWTVISNTDVSFINTT